MFIVNDKVTELILIIVLVYSCIFIVNKKNNLTFLTSAIFYFGCWTLIGIFMYFLNGKNLLSLTLGWLCFLGSIFIDNICMQFFNKKKHNIYKFFTLLILHIYLLYFYCSTMFNFNDELSNLFNSSTYLLLIAILFITHGGAIVVKEVLTSFHILDEKEINKNQAGQIIGFLERLFIFWFVYIDKWEGIGFLIAAKSILRFNNKDEKKETAHTEYVLVGTLVSVGYAIVLSMLYRYIKSLIL